MLIGAAIRRARLTAGYSQDDLAYLAKMTRQYVSKVERECLIPQLDQISRIAIALQISAWSLVQDAEQIESLMIPTEAFNPGQHV